MSRTGTFSYTVNARCSAATATALLGDPRRTGELHPLIVSVAELPPAPGALASYAILDVLRWGPLRFRISYTADVLAASKTEVITVARQRPATTVHNVTRISTTGTGVHIEVTITLSAPRLLFRYAYRTARAAHLELGRRIEARLTALGA